MVQLNPSIGDHAYNVASPVVLIFTLFPSHIAGLDGVEVMVNGVTVTGKIVGRPAQPSDPRGVTV